ncbi:hypothetical protein MVES_000342 [Malassezia vespertilionis]|uniref:Protein LTV1 n=1 Tax=Malassezia vespertilionis TaxID=2020962 RepID=A0A2N1JHA4_9BASI|nr:hypothetical protein MVES_000342 [Malassezia vespertilionis]
MRKSIWRQPHATHFQVVHRSQRDQNFEAGPHVLKSVTPLNDRKGKSRADLAKEDPSLAHEDPNSTHRKNLGEAALYGIYYEDTDYDYMQHLRPVGDTENSRHGGMDEVDDTDTIWIPSSKPEPKPAPFALKEGEEAKQDNGLLLPASVFASEEKPYSHTAQFDEDPMLQGLQPDMDPHLRQTLEALEDDAFVDDGLGDNFFGDLLQDGAWDGKRGQDDTWRDEAPEGDAIYMDMAERARRERDALQAQGGSSALDELSLAARVALFKQQQASAAPDDSSDTEYASEARDDVHSLASFGRHARPAGSVSSTGSALGGIGKPGALARRAASTRAASEGGASSVWSMSSSSMARNKGLTELDEQFDRVLKTYDEAEDDAFFDEDEAETRGDFDSIMDEFLDTQEVIAGKLKQRLGARDATWDEKLDILRKELGEAHLTDNNEDASSPAAENPFLNPSIIGRDREKWDVQTIQSTKTNLENHPRTIVASSVGANTRHTPKCIVDPRAKHEADKIPKIRIDARTGVPRVVGYTHSASAPPKEVHGESEEDYSSDTVPVTIKRDRNESAEARRARKEAVKQQKQARREEKAATKHIFQEERKRQLHAERRQVESMGGGPAVHLA